MNKLVIYFVATIMILSVGVFADSGIRGKIKDVAAEEGIVVEDKDIVEMSVKDLFDVEVENTSIAVYKVNYSSKPLFVITSSDKAFEEQVVSSECNTRLLLHFGLSGSMGKSSFLNMVNGVQSDLDKGYIMLRDGSVTGISTNLEIINFVEGGEVEMIIYKNGEEIGFRNSLDAVSSGVKVDYDVQSKGIVNFKAGDIISIRLDLKKGVSLSDVTTTLELTN